MYLNIIFSEETVHLENQKMSVFVTYLWYTRNTFASCHFQQESLPLISSIPQRGLLASELSNDTIQQKVENTLCHNTVLMHMTQCSERLLIFNEMQLIEMIKRKQKRLLLHNLIKPETECF